ncbi:MAG: dihydropyrimidinase, partial [Chloroflexota bacterium]|nr:dihydropyrimidinase [Chloroflexota bacterium]
MNILFRGGAVATETETKIADLLVKGDKIVSVGTDLPVSDAKIVDCSGLILLPGGVEPHAHFSLPMFNTISSDNHFTGHRAAAFGGTTTVMDFTSQSPGSSLQQAIDLSHSEAAQIAAVDYSFHVNVTDFSEDVANEIDGLPSQGLTTLKV